MGELGKRLLNIQIMIFNFCHPPKLRKYNSGKVVLLFKLTKLTKTYLKKHK